MSSPRAAVPVAAAATAQGVATAREAAKDAVPPAAATAQGAAVAASVASAGALKDSANVLYAKGRRAEACLDYARALAILGADGGGGGDSASGGASGGGGANGGGGDGVSPLAPDSAAHTLSLALRSNLANCALQDNQPADALAHADAALQLAPDSAKALYRRAQALSALGRLADAESAAAAALAANPSSGEVAKLQAAVGARRDAAAAIAETAAAATAAAAAAAEAEAAAEAVAAAAAAAAVPVLTASEILSAAGAIKDRANSLFSSSKRSEACTEYGRALDMVTGSAAGGDAAVATLTVALRNNLANCALLDSQPAVALAHSDAALALAPSSAKALYRRAQALQALGRLAEAEVAAALAHEANPTNAEVAKLRTAVAAARAAP